MASLLCIAWPVPAELLWISNVVLHMCPSRLTAIMIRRDRERITYGPYARIQIYMYPINIILRWAIYSVDIAIFAIVIPTIRVVEAARAGFKTGIPHYN